MAGCQVDATHQEKGAFEADADIYRPDRWLEAGEEQHRALNRTFLASSAGKRTCTNIHVPSLEMKKTLLLLLIHFDVRQLPQMFALYVLTRRQLDLVNPQQGVRNGIRASAV